MEKKMKHKDVIKLVKRNEAQELVNGSYDYIKKHSENVIIWVVVCAIAVVGSSLFVNFRAANEVKAAQGVAEAAYMMNRQILDDPQAGMYGLFRTKKEKYEKAQAAYMSVINNYKGTKSEPAAYLGTADSYYSNGQYKEAMAYYDDFLKKFPSNPLAGEALSGRAYALFQQGLYSDAAKVWEDVNKKYNGGLNPQDVKLRLADCYLRLNNKEAARAEYQDILKDKSENYWTTAAKDMLSRTN
jgi:TolA-binding protein